MTTEWICANSGFNFKLLQCIISENGNIMPPILHEQAVISQSAPAVSNNPTQLLVNDSSSTEKTVIAAQRERTTNLHISKFASYFHPRLVDAAKEIGVCSTVLKKVCRKYCMKRWPYRKANAESSKSSTLENAK